MTFKAKKIFLSTLVTIPIIVLSSCSSSDVKSFNYVVEYINDKQLSLISPKKDFEDEVYNYPVEFYMKQPESINNTFEISVELSELLNGSNVEAKLEYHLEKNGDSIEFKITIYSGNKTHDFFEVIKGFKNTNEYVRDSRHYLQTLNLNSILKEKYELKEFIKNEIPSKNFSQEWKEKLEFATPPGFTLNFSDLKTERYDCDETNQYLTIGSFTSIFSEKSEDIKISIKNNFKNPTKPLYVFMVDDNGINLESSANITAEVIFIDRTTNNTIKFNNSLSGKGIYGEIDFSMFKSWTFSDEAKKSLFKTNNITSILLPREATKISSEMFLNNKILHFDIPLTITKIFQDSFDENVILGNLNNNPHLGLQTYYDPINKVVDLNNPNIINIDILLSLLELLSHKSDEFVVQKLIIPSSLLQFNKEDGDEKIRDINNLSITVDEVVFASYETVDINPLLDFYKWEIGILTIPEHIRSIKLSTIPKKNVRTLNTEVKEAVVNGVLDLRQVPPFGNMDLNLDYYYDLGNNSKDNIINILYLPNWNSFNSVSFDKIFKKTEKNNTIHISNKTTMWETLKLDDLGSGKIDVIREIPENLSNHFIDGHLDLSNLYSNKIIPRNFYRNLKYLKMKIQKITLPLNLVEIPESIFSTIDLSNLTEINNINTITKIGNNAFNSSKIDSIKLKELIFPKLLTIGFSAFANNNLTSINIPKAIDIGSSAFYDNKLTSINIPETTTIGDSAFYNNKLTSINIPKAIDIGSSAFANNELSGVIINEKANMHKTSFFNNTEIRITNPIINIPGLYDKEKQVIDFTKIRATEKSYNDAMKELQFLILENTPIKELIWDLNIESENGHKIISDLNIVSIETLTIDSENDVRYLKIPDRQFENIEITNVNGLEKVGHIGSYAFYNSKIQNFNGISGQLKFSEKLETIGSYAFWNNQITTLIFEPSVKITEISYRSFYGNEITKIEIPKIVKYIDSNAFSPSSWNNLIREPIKSEFWDFDNKTGKLHFNKVPIDSGGVREITKSLNGLEIKLITFAKNIYEMPENFLQDLKVTNTRIELDLTNILIINKNYKFPKNIQLLQGTFLDVLYNPSNIFVENY